jgi:hypothetical protein
MKILSGGQSGVDRAALDAAVARGVEYGGWCPRGGWAEDYPQPPGLLARYPKLGETPLADPAQRTEWNARDADACLIIVEAGGLAVSRGTVLAREQAARYGKPIFIAELGATDVAERAARGCARSARVSAKTSRSPSAARARVKHRASTHTPSPSSAHCSTADPRRSHGAKASQVPGSHHVWVRCFASPRCLSRNDIRDAECSVRNPTDFVILELTQRGADDLNLRRHGGLVCGGRDVPDHQQLNQHDKECFLMRSKELIFGVAAIACVALAADASAQENQRHAGKTMGTRAGAAHVQGAAHANQQGMSVRANAGNRNVTAEERVNGNRAGNRNFAEERVNGTRAGNRSFAAEERMNASRAGNRNFAAEERTTRTRGYARDRTYADRDRFAGTRVFNDSRTFVDRDRVAETRINRGYGRTWRGDRFVGGVGAGAVAAGVDVGVNYGGYSGYGYSGYGYGDYRGSVYGGYPGYAYGYGYPGYGYGNNYGVGVGTGGLYAYAPGYGVSVSTGGLYAPGYGVGYTASAPLYSYAPGYVSTVGYSRGCRCGQ